MLFIAQSPLLATELKSSPPTPPEGTRGLFPMEDGWYDIDDNGDIMKCGAILISAHDDLSSIIPKNGQMYVIKHEDVAEGDLVYFKMAIGDGVTPLSKLPQILIEDVRKYVDDNISAQIGDITTALDEIISIEEAYINAE